MSGPPIDPSEVAAHYADWFSHGLRGVGMRYLFSRQGLWVLNTPYRRILAAAGISADDHVLDVGCGIGNILIALAERTAFREPLCGVDVSSVLVDLAQREIDRAGLTGRVLVQPAPATRLPFADASFDLALTSHVIKHLDDDAIGQAFSEIARVLRPSGRLILWEFRKSRRSAPLFWSARLSGLPPAFQLRSADELSSALRTAGFTRVRRIPTGIFLVPPVPRIALLASR